MCWIKAITVVPFAPSGGRGLFGLGEVGGADPMLGLPVLEAAAESNDTRGRFAFPVLGES